MLLEMKNVYKSFPGVIALNDVYFSLKKGEVHALLGENGAGKSTLIKILAGIYQLDKVQLILDGQGVTINSVLDAKKLGISVIHQEISLVPKLSVANNITLGTGKERIFIDRKERRKTAYKAIKDLGFDIDVDAKVDTLSIAQQQIVEIVRALSVHNAKIIVMDEPTASISEKDTEKLFIMIQKLKEKGIGIIYISHRMEEVKQIADRVTVFRDGNYIDTRDVKDTSMETIVNMMVGRSFEEIYHYNIEEVGETILETNKISNNHIENIDFNLRKGEVHGIYGLVGAGRTELARALFGLDKYQGEILINGEKAVIKTSKDAMSYGLALVPENRKLDGLFINNTVKFNALITLLDKFMRFFMINRKVSKDLLEQFQTKLKIKYHSKNQKAATLSGGNQQKVVLSKWLGIDPDILILDEPTRGIDVGAKFEIYDLIFKLTEQGKSIILISSELPEIINLCTRVSIMKEGKIVGTLQREEFDQEKIFEYAIADANI